MFKDIVRRASAFAALSVLAGCTGLVSEKPVFAPSDYDTSGSLLGHYGTPDSHRKVVVARGADGGIVLLGYEYGKPENKPEGAAQTDADEVLAQSFYAEGAVIPLGGGDFVLQISCSAMNDNGKDFYSWLGGRQSPYRAYTSYGYIAQDRSKSYLWASSNFYSSRDEPAAIFNKYGVETAPKIDGKSIIDARIIPPGISKGAIRSLFRELIAQDMDSGDSGELYQRRSREPALDSDEAKATRLNDSAECRRIQLEGEPPPK